MLELSSIHIAVALEPLCNGVACILDSLNFRCWKLVSWIENWKIGRVSQLWPNGQICPVLPNSMAKVEQFYFQIKLKVWPGHSGHAQFYINGWCILFCWDCWIMLLASLDSLGLGYDLTWISEPLTCVVVVVFRLLLLWPLCNGVAGVMLPAQPPHTRTVTSLNWCDRLADIEPCHHSRK